MRVDKVQQTKGKRAAPPLSPELQRAKNWYRWLWLSPLLTLPTETILSLAGNGLACSFVSYSRYCSSGEGFPIIAILSIPGAALWHLILLVPALDKESAFVRGHGRQALLLAGVRTVLPLGSVLLSGDEGSVSGLTILALILVWFFGTRWGQRQAARGDCSLMRWRGQAEDLPGPPAQPKPDTLPDTPSVAPATADQLIAVIRNDPDPVKRQAALAQLSKLGLVEPL